MYDHEEEDPTSRMGTKQRIYYRIAHHWYQASQISMPVGVTLTGRLRVRIDQNSESERAWNCSKIIQYKQKHNLLDQRKRLNAFSTLYAWLSLNTAKEIASGFSGLRWLVPRKSCRFRKPLHSQREQEK